ncbi:MAG: MarC family protein [Ottowia sp.]|nr:hypothetical protein [Ottowia sp.]
MDTLGLATTFGKSLLFALATMLPIVNPLACGPGTIAVAIALGASLHSKRVWISATSLMGGLLAMMLVGALAALTFRYAEPLLARFGHTGRVVLVRLMAFLLLCIGIEPRFSSRTLPGVHILL